MGADMEMADDALADTVALYHTGRLRSRDRRTSFRPALARTCPESHVRRDSSGDRTGGVVFHQQRVLAA